METLAQNDTEEFIAIEQGERVVLCSKKSDGTVEYLRTYHNDQEDRDEMRGCACMCATDSYFRKHYF